MVSSKSFCKWLFATLAKRSLSRARREAIGSGDAAGGSSASKLKIMFGKMCARALGRCNSTALLTASWMSSASGGSENKGRRGLGDSVVVVAFSVGEPGQMAGSRNMRFGDGNFGGDSIATTQCVSAVVGAPLHVGNSLCRGRLCEVGAYGGGSSCSMGLKMVQFARR